MEKSFEFTGKSVEIAIAAACDSLHMDRDAFSVEVLDIGKKGFLGLGATQAKVRVTFETPDEPKKVEKPAPKAEKPAPKVQTPAPKVEKPAPKAEKKEESPRLVKQAPKTDKPAQPKVEKPAQPKADPTQQPRLVKQAAKTDKTEAPAPRAERAPRPERAPRVEREPRVERAPREEIEYPVPVPMDADKIPENAKVACAFIEGLMEKMGVKGKATVLASTTADHVQLDLSGDDMGQMIGRRGDTLDSVQYLASLVMNKGLDDHVRLTIDAENYRVKRMESLERLARKMAVKVTKYHRPMTLEPMNPYERRVIHSALQEFRGVTTYSTGSDPNRRVVIAPEGGARKPQGGNRPRTERPRSDRPRPQKAKSVDAITPSAE